MRTRNHRITTRVDWPGRTQDNQPVPLEGGNGNGGGGAPDPHAPTHETGGSDPIDTLDASVLTSGTIPDARLSANVQLKPIAAADLPAHATRHQVGGSDPLAVTTLGGYPGGTTTFLRADGSFAAPPVGGTPGGSTTHVQFNDGGVFGGDAGLTYDKTTDGLTVVGSISTSLIKQSTVDGTDNSYLALCGGGAQSRDRGGYITIGGNEQAGPGVVSISMGNVAGSYFNILKGDGNSALEINAIGNVSIGMTPDARLCVKQSNAGVAGGLRLVRSDTTHYADLYVGSDNLLYLHNNAAGYISLDSGGNAVVSGSLVVNNGLGVTSSSAVIATFNSTAANGGYYQVQQGGAFLYGVGTQLATTGSGTTTDACIVTPGKLFFYPSGASKAFSPHQSSNTDLGDTSHYWSTLYVNNIRSNTVLQLTSDAGLLQCMAVANSTTGTPQNVAVDTANGAIRRSVSSRRYKRDIEPLDGWRGLLDLRPVSFQHINDKERRVGLIAEEVAAVDPRLAVFNTDGQAEEVAYTHLTAPIIQAIQELHARLTALERTTDATQ